MSPEEARQQILQMERPARDAFWMGLAFYLSVMSHDSETKNGAVIINNLTSRILGTGFNGFPMGCRDEELPQTRPDKYLYIQHAERNAVLSVTQPCSDATLYCTMEPCEGCVGTILNQSLLYGASKGKSGVTRLVYWEERPNEAARLMLSHHPEIKVEQYYNPMLPTDVLRMVQMYCQLRPLDGLYKDGVASNYSHQ